MEASLTFCCPLCSRRATLGSESGLEFAGSFGRVLYPSFVLDRLVRIDLAAMDIFWWLFLLEASLRYRDLDLCSNRRLRLSFIERLSDFGTDSKIPLN